MNTQYKSELVGVFGHPVAENPTIVMVEAAFKDMDLDWRYLTIEVLPEDLEGAVAGLRAMNMKGINLTIPHKIEIMKYLDEISPDAELIGAVNTVRREGNKLIGENTDGKGFLKALREDGQCNPEGKKIMVLGAGGASRAICTELALVGAGEILIANRSFSKAETLAGHISSHTKTKASALVWKSHLGLPPDLDILVNATSIGLYPDSGNKPDIDYENIHPDLIVCDVIPNPPDTAFLKEARGRTEHTLDGLAMLVYQGVIGIRMWTGRDASVSVMKDALSEAFSG